MKYHIYPPIGISRVGNSPTEFFIAGETPESLGTELTAAGEKPLTSYKDSAFRIKRQAARFRIFQSDDAGGNLQPAVLPTGATVTWTVSVANIKDVVERDDNPPAEDGLQPPFPTPIAARANRAIIAEDSITTPGNATARLAGTYLKGTANATEVVIAELRSDGAGNLLVLPGFGISGSPENMPIGDEVINGVSGGGYYNNKGWFDDVCDGRVSAVVSIPGEPSQPATGAWFTSAPPDFAPGTEGVVTLYDVLLQTAINAGLATVPTSVSFSRDVWPMLRRASELRWVNKPSLTAGFWAGFNTNWSALADASAAQKPLRAAQATRLRTIGTAGQLRNFELRPWQEAVLTKWVNGDFVSDFTGQLPGAGVLDAATLTRTVLDGAVGQGFFPGIEVSLLVTDSSILAAPFRMVSTMKPGTLTGLMALPWQADFLDCAGSWWPSQRPDFAQQGPDGATRAEWLDPIDPDGGYRDLVNLYGKLGIIVPRIVGGKEVRLEEGRDPSLPRA